MAKVKGVLDELGNRNFIITGQNHTSTAMRQENGKYSIEINGRMHKNKLLRECKQLCDHYGRLESSEPDETATERQQPRSQWDCLHPCAIIIKLRNGEHVDERDIKETLDCFGYLTESGSYNEESAGQEASRWALRASHIRRQD